MNRRDSLEWALGTPDEQSLINRYDAWASTYDAEHDEWGWNGPMHAVDALFRRGSPDLVFDAGCGTGRVGTELRSRGWTGRLVGLDISAGMLGEAAASGTYDELVHGSLFEVPLCDASFDAVVSSGVFTHGHVNHEAFPELIRLTRPGGVVVITSREQVWEALEPHATGLEAAGAWTLVERTEPASFHPGRENDDRPQSTVTWRVT